MEWLTTTLSFKKKLENQIKNFFKSLSHLPSSFQFFQRNVTALRKQNPSTLLDAQSLHPQKRTLCTLYTLKASLDESTKQQLSSIQLTEDSSRDAKKLRASKP
jgi:hypothetical protein